MPRRLVGRRYLLEKPIGSGGMGTIWVAQDQQLQRRVALKLMQQDLLLLPASRSQFAHEAQAIAQLQHSHVVQIYDYGIDQDESESSTPYIVMELLTGEDLASRLDRHKRMVPASVVTILSQVAKALFTAHSLGLVHRDIKPANIFLARSEGSEIAKLLDFGVAAIRKQLRDTSEEALHGGTPYYMSPEQIRSPSSVDHRSDLFSLGIVAYEALAGAHPFQGATVSEIAARIASGAPFVRPSQLNPELGERADRFFEKALAFDPAERFQSAREMAQAFAALLDRPDARRRVRVLVVDDEPDVHLLIRHRFRQQIRDGQYEFLFASDGQQALEVLTREPDIDVVLSDINMPTMDGISLLQRAAEIDPLLKVVMVSAYGDMRNIRAAMNRGAFDFLTKPIDFRDLSVTIDKTAQHVQSTRMAARWAEENARLRNLIKGAAHEPPAGAADEPPASERCEIAVVVVRVTGWDVGEAGEGMASPDLAMSRLSTLLEIVFAEIGGHGGVVDALIDSAVVAFFRGPDHVVRALAACLAIRARWPNAVKAPHGVAIGVGSGEAVVAGAGARAVHRPSYTAVGGAVGETVELGLIAERGQILLGESLRDRAREAFSYEQVSRRPSAGLSESGLYNLLNGNPGKIYQQSPRGAREEIAMADTLADDSQPAEGRRGPQT